MKYDMIILANITGNSLGDFGQEMIVDFVKAGGGLLILGGDRTFGQTHFSNKNFVDLLPVKLRGPFDWRKLNKPALLRNDTTGICSGVRLNDNAVVLFAHLLKPKRGTSVSVWAGDKPIVITREYGRGRVAVVLAIPFGEAPTGRTNFWQSRAWQRVMAKIMYWLMKR